MATSLPLAPGVRSAASADRDKLAMEGLVSTYTYAWTGLSPGFTKLIKEGKLVAWNLPLGVVSHMIRCACSNGLYSHIQEPASMMCVICFVCSVSSGMLLGSLAQSYQRQQTAFFGDQLSPRHPCCICRADADLLCSGMWLPSVRGPSPTSACPPTLIPENKVANALLHLSQMLCTWCT